MNRTRRFALTAFTVALVLVPPTALHAASKNIESLKDLHLNTALVTKGVSECRIVIPEGDSLREQGRRVQEALGKTCGVEIAMADSGAIADGDYRKFNMILLGNMMNNRVIARLYARHYCFTDAFYPGRNGYEVRTIHNPMGCGHNFVLLGGSDADGVRTATDKFLALLGGGGVLSKNDRNKTVTLARLRTGVSLIPAKEKTDDAYVADRLTQIRQRLDNGLVMQQMHSGNSVVDAGMCYYLTGEEGWGKIFRDSLLYYYELAQRKDDWMLLYLGADAGGQYFWPWKLVIVWDNVEEGSVFTNEDRLKITNLLLNITRWCANLDHFYLDRPAGVTYGSPAELRQGHPTYAAMSLFFGAEYFRMYYPAVDEFQPRYADLDRMFAGQALSYKSNDNGARYSPLAPRHYLCHLMTQRDLDPQSAENLRKFADSVIITTDNRADGCTFGDTNEYMLGYTDALPFLSKASWYFKDAGYLWAYDWIERRSYDSLRSRTPRYNIWYEGLYYAGGARSEPARLLGVVPLKVDLGLYDFMRKKLAELPDDKPPVVEKCFDKLSCRRSFAAEDEYLLLSGLSDVLTHGHEDGNSVLRLTWNDRIWLADLSYRDKAPNEHNSLMVLRDGQYNAIPAFTALETCAELPAAGFTKTTVPNYNGVDWSRNILWHKGEYFLFLDEVAARRAGDYRLQLVWRTLGDAELVGNDLTATQAGQTFNISNGDRSLKNLSLKKQSKIADWSRYPHADGTVRVLSQMYDFKSAGTDDRVYVNLLYPGDPKHLSLERIGPRSVRISAGKEAESLVAFGGDSQIHAAAYQIGRDRLAVFDGRRISLAGLELQSDNPLSLELDWRTAQGTLNAAQATEVGINAAAILLDGKLISTVPKAGLARFHVPAGTHQLKLEGHRLQSLSTLLDKNYPVPPGGTVTAAPQVKEASRLWEFKAHSRRSLPETLTAMAVPRW